MDVLDILGRRLRKGDVPRFALAALLSIALTLLLRLLHDYLTIANFSLIYVMAVVLMAVRLGTGPSLVAALICFLGFNFFLVRPFYTFMVAHPRELLDLLIFLFVAIITGQMSAYARRQAANANQRTYEQEVLFRLTSAFNKLTAQTEVYRVLQRVLEEDLHVQMSQILPDRQIAQVADTTAYTLLEADDHIYGTLRVTFAKPPTPWQLRMLAACAAQASAALARIDLTRQAAQSQSFEEADKLKTALLHAVSHDLRTPITIIKSSASNLVNLQARLSAPEQREMLEMIETEADQLNAMVEDLLEMSRLRAGALRLNKDWCSLEEIAGDVAAAVWQRARAERVRLCFPDDLPLVQCDYALMLRVLANLVDNSLRYEPAESQIEITGSSTPETVSVRVINHGPSIPASEHDLIMQPFYRGPDGHIGLGLAIAKGIVEAHDGHLRVEDTPAGGATFVVTLPRTPERVP